MQGQPKASWVSAAVAFLMVLSAGCAGLQQIQGADGLSGLTSRNGETRILEEPANPPVAVRYRASNAHQTMAVPARLNMPDRRAGFTVGSVRSDLFASPYVVASFRGGNIMEREFAKVLAANFREPLGGETPAVELAVRVVSVVNKQRSDKAPMNTALRLNIEVARPDGGGTAYSKSLDAEATAAWSDRSKVPESFYQALSGAIDQFLEEWERSGGADMVARWAGNATPGAIPPELREIVWEGKSGSEGIQRGCCTIECNGFEGFRAKHWADAQIAEACRTKLGHIGADRVRVVYDDESYDAEKGIWTCSFRCFARNERVLDFNSVTGHGTVIGDWELMGMRPEAAAEELKAYVLEEMKSHAGVVTSSHRGSEAYVRFDTYKTDPQYNLIRIDFRLLR